MAEPDRNDDNLSLNLSQEIYSEESYVYKELQTEEDFSIDEMRRRITGEAPNELMSFSLLDSEVSLFLTGSWNGTLQINPAFSFSPLGMKFSAFDSPFFMQETDLTLSLWINEKWFVEANFIESYGLQTSSNIQDLQNTYRAGYQGFPGEFLQYAGIGNTGLDFPSFPYMDLGGDSPSSFGFYSRFGTENLNFHALFRYDASSREERVFTGNRERTYSYVQVQDTIRGVSFVLPDTDIDPLITVYIQDDKGEHIDSSARRWRIALSSEYAVSNSLGLLELSVRPNRMIAVSYSRLGDTAPWKTSMGAYDSTGFLFEIQKYFDPLRKEIKLENYPQAGSYNSSSKPGEVFFGGKAALVLYENGAFSPFERRNRYDAPSSTSEHAALVSFSTGEEKKGFNLIPFDASQSGFLDMISFSSMHMQDLHKQGLHKQGLQNTVSRRAVYELLKDSNSRRDPQTMFPLAQEFPEIYLPPYGVFSGDLSLRFTNYNSSGGYYIGTDAVPGSVQVWRSGIQDANFQYNASTGEVIISSSVGQNEIIRITYLKRSEDSNAGSIAAGLGAVYNGKSAFSALGAVGVRMNITEDSFSNENRSSAGFIGVSGKAAWDYDFLKAYITGAFTFEQTDTTGLYRVSGMEGNEIILPLPPDNSFISNPPSSNIIFGLNASNRFELIYRNYYNNNILGSNLMNIDSNVSVISGINRPYPAKDSQLGDNQVLVAEFDFNGNEKWTGFQVPLNYNADILSRAVEIEIPFRLYNFNAAPVNFKLIIQIGSLSGKDFAFTENLDLIWERTLFTDDWSSIPNDPNAFYYNNTFNYNTKIARFTLSEEDRMKLGNAEYLRLIIVSENAQELNGRIILAHPIIRSSAFRAVTYSVQTGFPDGVINENKDRVTALETMDTGNTLLDKYPEIIRKLHVFQNSDSNIDTQRILKINWKNMEEGFSAGVDTRVNLIPLSDYREISFFIKPGYEQFDIDNNTLRFIIVSGYNPIENNANFNLDVNIPMNLLKEGQWSKVTIRYQGENQGLSIDGIKTQKASFTYKPQSFQDDSPHKQGLQIRSDYIAFFINSNSTRLNDGVIFIDEIILEDALTVYRMNAGAGIDYSKRGQIVSIGNINVLSDFSVSSAFESEARIGNETDEKNKQGLQMQGSVINRTSAQISVFTVKISGSLASVIADNTFIWSADHDISRTFGAFSFKETFYASPDDLTARHTFNLSFNSDFFTKFEADALYDINRLRQNWIFDIGYIPKNINIPSIKLITQALWLKNEQIQKNNNYAQLWIDSWRTLVPDSGLDADTRRANAQFVITQRTRPLGAVISIEGNIFSSKINNISQFENSAFLDIPVNFNRLSFNFRGGRIYKTNLTFTGKDIFEDTDNFIKTSKNALYFWEIFPFYSLFSDDINYAMEKALNKTLLTQYAYFNDHFSARINLPAVYNLASFIIPARLIFRLDRILEQKYDTRVDYLNIGGVLNFSSINMFGAMGYIPIFNFYQSDEFNHTIDTAFVIPMNNYEIEELSFRIQSIFGARFRGFTGSNLNFINTFTMRKNNLMDYSWMESFIASWEAPVKNSLVNFFYNRLIKSTQTGFAQGDKQAVNKSRINLTSFLNSNYESLRRESLEFIFDKTPVNLSSVSSDYLRWAVFIGHEEIIRILGRFNLSGFLKLKVSDDQYSETFKFDILLGTALRISF